MSPEDPVPEEGARVERVCPKLKLCSVSVVLSAVASAETVLGRATVARSRFPRRRHSRPSWGLLTSKIVRNRPRNLAVPRAMVLASDVMSLQSLQGQVHGPATDALSWG